jgi:hypothetical protein
MKRFHLVFGLITFIVFLLTGQYMDRYHQHLAYMADGPRLLYRTRHIFILMSALLHIGIGSYFRYWRVGWRRILQVVGSALITIAPVLFTIAFFYEPHLQDLNTPLSLIAMILISVGTLLHLLSGLREPAA